MFSRERALVDGVAGTPGDGSVIGEIEANYMTVAAGDVHVLLIVL